MKKYSGYQPKIYKTSYGEVTSLRKLINDYVCAIPFEARRESYADRDLRYRDFKRWMMRDLNIDGGPDYDYGIKRICWKLWI